MLTIYESPFLEKKYYDIGRVKANCSFEHAQKAPYNFDPFRPHFYVVKLGFTGVYIIFLISAQKQIVGTR